VCLAFLCLVGHIFSVSDNDSFALSNGIGPFAVFRCAARDNGVAGG